MKASWSGVIDCKGSVLLIEPAWQERRCVPAEFRGRRMRASKPDRREFLRNAALGGASAVLSIRRWAKEPSRRPNILSCIADDQSYRHASAYGSTWLWTPGFDRIAGEGVLFRNGLVSTPSCCPSRGSILTGQGFYRLKEASMNHTVWPSGAGLPLYTDLLAGSGYRVGFTGKPWGPGNWKVSGRRTDPCSPAHNQVKLAPPNKRISSIDYAGNLGAFLEERLSGQPFCFWVGFL